MNRWVRNDKGVALPLALLVLLTLSALVLAFASMAGMEPQISRNLSDTTKARYLADTGVEYAYDRLVAAGDLNTVLGTGPQPVALANNQSLPGLPATSGTFSVTVRNDNQAGDTQITGQPLDPGPNDTNNIVIVTATGTYNNMTRTIQVAMTGPWDLPAAIFVDNPDFEFELEKKAIIKGSFTVTGNDTNLNGTAGSGGAKLGIGVITAAQVTSVNNALTPNLPTQPLELRPQVTGLGGNPTGTPPVASVGLVNPIPANLTTSALTTLVTQLTASPDQVITSDFTTGNLIKPGGAPQVTVVDLAASATGEITISGTGIGKGILIVKGGAVKGELKIGGSFQFQGLIIACCRTGVGELEMEIEDTAKVFGGLVMFGTAGETEIEMEDNGTLMRSNQGMALARQLIPNGRGTVWSWREL